MPTPCPAAEQAAVADAIQHYTGNALLSDPVSVSLVLGLFGWVVAMIAAAVAFRSAGAGWPVTVLVGLASAFAVHPPPVGPAALVCFAAAAVLVFTCPSGWRPVLRRQCRLPLTSGSCSIGKLGTGRPSASPKSARSARWRTTWPGSLPPVRCAQSCLRGAGSWMLPLRLPPRLQP